MLDERRCIAATGASRRAWACRCSRAPQRPASTAEPLPNRHASRRRADLSPAPDSNDQPPCQTATPLRRSGPEDDERAPADLLSVPADYTDIPAMVLSLPAKRSAKQRWTQSSKCCGAASTAWRASWQAAAMSPVSLSNCTRFALISGRLTWCSLCRRERHLGLVDLAEIDQSLADANMDPYVGWLDFSCTLIKR